MEKPLLSGNNRTSITKYTRKAGTTKIDFSNMTLDKLIREGGYECECGRHHGAGLKYLKIGRDATQHTVEAMQAIGMTRYGRCLRWIAAFRWNCTAFRLE